MTKENAECKNDKMLLFTKINDFYINNYQVYNNNASLKTKIHVGFIELLF